MHIPHPPLEFTKKNNMLPTNMLHIFSSYKDEGKMMHIVMPYLNKVRA